jgi:type IV secretory pathway VirB10-like protein
MAETRPVPAAPPAVTDRRPIPRGVLPRGVQTWIMAGIALGMLAIMLFVGRPEPPARTTAAPAAAQPSADRVRDYQERLRALEAQALLETQAASSAPAAAAPTYEERRSASPSDPMEAERKRREYESLFASNVALSRRPEGERPDAGRAIASGGQTAEPSAGPPSIDEIADAAVRATARVSGASQPQMPQPSPSLPSAVAQVASTPDQRSRPPEKTDAISPAGPLHRILEGTLVDTVLTNRLDGSTAAPVNCLVTNPVYSYSGQHVLIPAGARALGHTRPVQAQGETRLAVTFHRLVMPDGRTYRLDEFTGLNQIGDAGLRDRVNQHYLSTFGAAAAVGLISGLAQYLGNVGLGIGDGDRTVIIAGGVGDATSQATIQVMNRLLNRLPTITIREGHRVKVYLTSDLELPAYMAQAVQGRF